MRRLAVPLLVLAACVGPARVHAQDATDTDVVCRDGRQQAEQLEARGAYAEAAQLYVSLARRSDPPCARRDELLWNGAIEYESARLMGRAIQVRLALINNFGSSPLAMRARYLVAGNYHALAIYSQAADLYYAFAVEHPGELGDSCTARERDAGVCPDAVLALENAIFFYLGLGQLDAAEDAAELYQRQYGARQPARSASVALEIVMAQHDLEQSVSHATAFLATYDRTARLDERARALVQLAEAQLDQGRKVDALATFARVIAIVTPTAITAIPGTGAEQALRVSRARESLAEAILVTAEQQSITIAPPPHYTGQHSAAGLHAWMTGAFTRWRARQLAAIQGALGASVSARAVDVPEWIIASHAFDGELHAEVLRAAETVEMPDWADADDALAETFERERDAALAPLRARAIASYEQCGAEARRLRWLSEDAARCDEALIALDPEHHPTASELAAAPRWIADGVAPPGVPQPPRSDAPETQDATATDEGRSTSAVAPAASHEQLRALIGLAVPAVRACYETGLARDATLHGRVLTVFVIQTDGSVRDDAAVESELTPAGEVADAVAACILDVVGGMHFGVQPALVGIRYPFVLDATDGGGAP